MKIVLLADIEKLGSAGDVVNVKDGYARNYLIPGSMAVKADARNMRILESQKRAAEARAMSEMKTHKTMAARIGQLELIAHVQVGEEDKMFGAVTSADIAEMMMAKGVEIDRRTIDMSEPIKSLGIYNIPIKLHSDLNAIVKLRVEKAEQ